MTHINRWIAYAMKMECQGCGDRIFSDEEDASRAARAAIEAGRTEPPELHEYHWCCGSCVHTLYKDD